MLEEISADARQGFCAQTREERARGCTRDYRGAVRGPLMSNERALECLRQIGDQIVAVLDTDGQPYRSSVNERDSALRRGVLLAAEQSRRHHQRFRGAQTRADREVRESLGKAAPLVVAAVQLEAHHRAEITHLALRQFVLRMGGKTRVVDAFHPRMRLEETAHAERVGALPL